MGLYKDRQINRDGNKKKKISTKLMEKRFEKEK